MAKVKARDWLAVHAFKRNANARHANRANKKAQANKKACRNKVSH